MDPFFKLKSAGASIGWCELHFEVHMCCAVILRSLDTRCCVKWETGQTLMPHIISNNSSKCLFMCVWLWLSGYESSWYEKRCEHATINLGSKQPNEFNKSSDNPTKCSTKIRAHHANTPYIFRDFRFFSCFSSIYISMFFGRKLNRFVIQFISFRFYLNIKKPNDITVFYWSQRMPLNLESIKCE